MHVLDKYFSFHFQYWEPRIDKNSHGSIQIDDMSSHSRKTDPPKKKPFSQLSSESESELTGMKLFFKRNKNCS